MVLDTSALVAVLFDEPERHAFVSAIAAARRRLISSATLVESSIVVEARRGEAAGRELDLFLHRATVQTVAVDEAGAAGACRLATLRERAASGRVELRRSVRVRPRSRQRRTPSLQGQRLRRD